MTQAGCEHATQCFSLVQADTLCMCHRGNCFTGSCLKDCEYILQNGYYLLLPWDNPIYIFVVEIYTFYKHVKNDIEVEVHKDPLKMKLMLCIQYLPENGFSNKMLSTLSTKLISCMYDASKPITLTWSHKIQCVNYITEKITPNRCIRL